ncbi:endonuclease/exonuclease/phosphatase family protein [Miltoncostaea marina]|uniref:endonuclease/exonuclease/phosphatase family protein n=1 Tax=Miltoncostaea marina TaxID=2843215 RepID=UPI001C3D8F59|nr:endonuclease/exonuclease/phosphatase family protein [Miltoncostaea marina]
MTDGGRLRVLSWNVAGRVAVLERQIARVVGERPDVVLLQETTRRTTPAWREALEAAGLGVRATEPPGPGARRLGALAAARGHVRDPAGAPTAPWPERLAGVVAEGPSGPLEAWSAYVPQAANGWVKVETLEALAALLVRPGAPPRLLGGDLNTPRAESAEGEITTFAQRRRGAAPIPGRGPRWDLAERRILTGLAPEVVDAFRALHGYGVRARSWVYPSGMGGYRLDHLLLSRELTATAVAYRHDWREEGLSDHAALVAEVARA